MSLKINFKFNVFFLIIIKHYVKVLFTLGPAAQATLVTHEMVYSIYNIEGPFTFGVRDFSVECP